MSKPVLYLFNGKVGSFGRAFLGFTPPEPPTFDSVQIGDQIWMSKNLAIDDGGEGISTVTVNYGQGDVVEYQYTWDAAVRVAASVTGWHLPTKEEFDALVSYVGSKSATKLKSTYGWGNYNGTDQFGFTGLPAGDGSSYVMFWSSTTYSSSQAYARMLISYMSDFDSISQSKTISVSVRLIKDS